MIGPRLVLAVAFVLTASSAARADNLDVALVHHVWNLRKELIENRKVQNIGVLNFRVQKGSGAESFALGSLSTSLPLRVETALIVTNHPTKPYGVIRNAAAVVEKRKVAWFTRPADRTKLFAFDDYPLAWGTVEKRVKPDVFLTGVVKIADDLSKLTVTLEAIAADAPGKLHTLATFDVATDRELLRELGQSFAVPQPKGRTRGDRNLEAVADARKRDLAPGNDLSPDDVCGIRLRVLYDDVAQLPRRDERSPGEWRIDPPRAGQRVVLEIGHTGKLNEPLGVCLRINGKSVWSQVEGPVDDKDTGIWVFKPGDPAFGFKGFLYEGKKENLIPFRVLSEADSAAREAEFGERVGVIDVDVLASRKEGDPEGEVLSISRGLSRSLAAALPPPTCEELRKRILEKNPLLRSGLIASSTRGIIGADDTAVVGPEIPMASLPDRKLIGRLTLRYYDPQGAGALQISK